MGPQGPHALQPKGFHVSFLMLWRLGTHGPTESCMVRPPFWLRTRSPHSTPCNIASFLFSLSCIEDGRDIGSKPWPLGSRLGDSRRCSLGSEGRGRKMLGTQLPYWQNMQKHMASTLLGGPMMFSNVLIRFLEFSSTDFLHWRDAPAAFEEHTKGFTIICMCTTLSLVASARDIPSASRFPRAAPYRCHGYPLC